MDIREQLRLHALHFGQAMAGYVEVEAMKAHNKQCEFDNIPPKYGYDDFMNVAKTHGLEYNALIDKTREYYF